MKILVLVLFEINDSLLFWDVKEATVHKSEFVVLGLPIILEFVPL
jgi:hypothetical protein